MRDEVRELTRSACHLHAVPEDGAQACHLVGDDPGAGSDCVEEPVDRNPSPAMSGQWSFSTIPEQ